jgi:hypothetical protein
MKLICGRTTFIPGFCVFTLHQRLRRVSAGRAVDYLPFSNRYAEWLSVPHLKLLPSLGFDGPVWQFRVVRPCVLQRSCCVPPFNGRRVGHT